jgi:hypothetical protein
MKTNIFLLLCIVLALLICENIFAGDATISGNIIRKVTTTSTSASIPIRDCNGNVTGSIAGISTSIDSYPAYTAFTTVTIKIFAKDTAGSPVSTIPGLSKTDIGFNSSTGAFSYPVTGIAASRYSYIAKVCLDADVNSAYVREFTISTGGAIFPIGSVIAYAGNTTTVADLETSGWYKCDGRAISSLTASLSADEISAFQNVVGSYLPDLRGMFLRGLDEGRGYDDDRLTRTGGEGTSGVRSYQGCKLKTSRLLEVLIVTEVTDILVQQMPVEGELVGLVLMEIADMLQMIQAIIRILLLLIMQELTLTQYLYLMMQAVEMKHVQKIQLCII